MGDFDAIEATRRLRLRERVRSRTRRDLPPSILIAMNESDRNEVREKCLAAGMDDFIAKPPTVETVLALLENWGPLALAREAAPAAAEKPVPPASPETSLAGPPATIQPTDEKIAPPLPVDTSFGRSRPPAASSEPEQEEESPVDFELLLESANGDWSGVFELVDLYLDQTEHRFEQLISAISQADAAEIEKLARSGAGASETCGIRSLIKPLSDMQSLAGAGNLEGAELACSEAIQEYERLRAYLDRQRRVHFKAE